MSPKINRYVKTFKIENGDNNNKLMSFSIDDDKLLEKYKTNSTKIERRLKNNKLNSFPLYDDRYIKAEIKRYSNKVYNKFSNLTVQEKEVECTSLTITSIYSLLAYYNKYYMQVYLDNSAYNIVNTGMLGYLNDNRFGII